MLVLLSLASLAYGVIPTHRALGARLPVSRSWTVRQTLSFCRVHPRTRDRASSVRGYYFAFQPGAGPAAFGELLSSPAGQGGVAGQLCASNDRLWHLDRHPAPGLQSRAAGRATLL